MGGDRGFGRWVFGFDGNSMMCDLEWDNLIKDKEDEGGEDERFMTIFFLGVFLIGGIN